jgi:hypothetical protein
MEAEKQRNSSDLLGEVSGPLSDVPLVITVTTAQVEK